MNFENSFSELVNNISIPYEESTSLMTAHQELQDNLEEYIEKVKEENPDSRIGEIINRTFVQGSFKRGTAIKSTVSKKPDIDVVLVTKMAEGDFDPPSKALEYFEDFLNNYYKGKWRMQGRSLGVFPEGDVELDLVITSDPKKAELGFLEEDFLDSTKKSRAYRADSFQLLSKSLNLSEDYEFQLEKYAEIKLADPLRIPDRKAEIWDDTNPMAQIQWTILKDFETGNQYLNLVKMFKWMKLSFKGFDEIKSYPLEHIIGDCCNTSYVLSEMFINTLKNIVANYQNDISKGRVPSSIDRGTDKDIFEHIDFKDFKKFYTRMKEVLVIALSAEVEDEPFESAKKWQVLFGKEFPLPEIPDRTRFDDSLNVNESPKVPARFS